MGVTPPPWTGPAVGLMDLDAFFASVEMLDHPEWRGKPLIVGGDADSRGVVSTCSYEAVALACALPWPRPRRGACARKPFGRTGTLIATAR